MTWSYNVGGLSSSVKDQIRLEIGDNASGRSVTLQDEEINFAISVERNNWGAAARCAEMLAAQFLSKADTRLGRSLMLQYTKQAEQFEAKSKRLRAKSIATNVPWVGGMSPSDKQNFAENDTLVQPLFTRTMMDDPWVGGYSSDSSDEGGGDPDAD